VDSGTEILLAPGIDSHTLGQLEADLTSGFSLTPRNEKREYLKDKINELATDSKNNIRDLYRGTM
jgi:hypothetical protein